MDQEPQKPHRSIQDIIPPARSRPIRPNITRDTVPPMPQGPGMPPPPSAPTPPQPLDMNPNRPRGTGAFILFGVVFVIVVAAILGIVSTFFHRADVLATPHRYSAQVETSFETAPQHPLLPYEKVSSEETMSKSVPASGSQHVENRASGTITVYNAYSTKSERLITNTRFRTPDGLIFKVHNPITIPGYTMKAGIKVPGTVDVTVHADEPGEKYNVAMTDFVLPALSTSEQELIYAKSKTAMSGGFVGTQAVVDSAVRAQTVEALKADLERSLRTKISTTAPTGHVVFPDTVVVTYAEKTDTAEGENAIISVSGTAVAPSFPMQSFAKVVADAGGVLAEGSLSVENPSDLSVHINAPDSLGTDTPLMLAVSGLARLVAVVDTDGLARDLAGKNKDALQTILPGYPGIADVTIKVYPFWRSAAPANPKDIKVTVGDGLDQTR